MKKRYLLMIIVLFIAIMNTGCEKTKEENTKPKEEKEAIQVTATDMDTMKMIAEKVFIVEKDSLKVEDLTQKEKAEIARSLSSDFTGTTGSVMTENFKKYFGQTENIEFDDILCRWDHGSEDENIIYKFNKETDRYEYNEKHPGHGGGGQAYIGTKMSYENVESDSKTVSYNVKILFYGQAVCDDTGICEYGKAYKSYQDATKEENSLVDIDNSEYTTKDEFNFPKADIDKVLDDYKEKLDTYQFVFEKEGENLIFKSYRKKTN